MRHSLVENLWHPSNYELETIGGKNVIVEVDEALMGKNMEFNHLEIIIKQ